jgi:hypothetical protein
MLRVHFTTNAVDGTTQKEEKVTHNIKHIYIYIYRGCSGQFRITLYACGQHIVPLRASAAATSDYASVNMCIYIYI